MPLILRSQHKFTFPLSVATQTPYLAINNNQGFQLQKLVEEKNSELTYIIDEETSKKLPKQVSNFVFSFDSYYLALVSGRNNNEISLINLSNPQSELIEFKPNQSLSKIETIIFSPSLIIKLNSIDKYINLNVVVTAESNGKIRVWDFDGNEVAKLNSNHNQVSKLLFSPKRLKKNRTEEYPDYLIAIEKDENKNTIVQSWNITEELDLELLLQQGCEFLDKNMLSSDDVDKFSINEVIYPECDKLNTSMKKIN